MVLLQVLVQPFGVERVYVTTKIPQTLGVKTAVPLAFLTKVALPPTVSADVQIPSFGVASGVNVIGVPTQTESALAVKQEINGVPYSIFI